MPSNPAPAVLEEDLTQLQTRLLTMPEGPVWLSKEIRLTPLPWPLVTSDWGDILAQRAWRWLARSITIMATLDNTPAHGVLLHVSVAHPKRLPTWSEVKLVRERFFPDDIDVMMVLPRASDYVNEHKFCFQLYQVPTPWLLQ